MVLLAQTLIWLRGNHAAALFMKTQEGRGRRRILFWERMWRQREKSLCWEERACIPKEEGRRISKAELGGTQQRGQGECRMERHKRNGGKIIQGELWELCPSNDFKQIQLSDSWVILIRISPRYWNTFQFCTSQFFFFFLSVFDWQEKCGRSSTVVGNPTVFLLSPIWFLILTLKEIEASSRHILGPLWQPP